MELTVCICTYNRPDYVADCLTGLRQQSVPDPQYRVVLVDSGSPDPARLALHELASAFDIALIRVDRPGVSAARNAGARWAGQGYIAYIDDDAVPASDWVERIFDALSEPDGPPTVIGGRILPSWEAPLPNWWPPSLRGVLSIIEHEGFGTYRTSELPAGLEPYAANLIVAVEPLLAIGGFGQAVGRYGDALLSDEEVQVAWALQNRGERVVYDSRIVVHHQIQARRLNAAWLLSRLYWQGASTVLTRMLLRDGHRVWRELPRRIGVLILCAPFALIPRRWTWMIAPRWRFAYAAGFVRAALGWRAARSASMLAGRTK